MRTIDGEAACKQVSQNITSPAAAAAGKSMNSLPTSKEGGHLRHRATQALFITKQQIIFDCVKQL